MSVIFQKLFFPSHMPTTRGFFSSLHCENLTDKFTVGKTHRSVGEAGLLTGPLELFTLRLVHTQPPDVFWSHC